MADHPDDQAYADMVEARLAAAHLPFEVSVVRGQSHAPDAVEDRFAEEQQARVDAMNFGWEVTVVGGPKDREGARAEQVLDADGNPVTRHITYSDTRGAVGEAVVVERSADPGIESYQPVEGRLGDERLSEGVVLDVPPASPPGETAAPAKRGRARASESE